MDIRNKYKVVYFINQHFFDYFLREQKNNTHKKIGVPRLGHSDNINCNINYIKLFASARISSPIASAASWVGPSE